MYTAKVHFFFEKNKCFGVKKIKISCFDFLIFFFTIYKETQKYGSHWPTSLELLFKEINTEIIF